MKYLFFIFPIVLMGCIPGPSKPNPLSQDHPAYGFYEVASRSTVSGRNCLKLQGSMEVPGSWKEGDRYQLLGEPAPGLYRVFDKQESKNLIVISFMEWSGFVTIPKTCSWEEKEGDFS